MEHARHVRASRAGLLGSRDFLYLWAIGGIGNAMRWLEVLAAALFTLDATGSQIAVAAVSAARALPLLVLGPFAGVLADAFDRRRIVLGGALLSAASAGAVAALAFAGRLHPWEVFAASLASGLVYSTEMSARRRMTGESVAPPHLARAVALDSLTNSASRVVGPLLGGGAYQWLGLAGTFAGSALLSLLAAGLAARVRHAQSAHRLSPAVILADLGEAAGVVRRTPVLLALMGATVAQNLFGWAYGPLVAPVGREVFGVSAVLIGVLAAAEPAGATLGGLALAIAGAPRGAHAWPLIGGSAALCALLAASSAASSFWAVALLLFAGGVGVSLYVNAQTVIPLTEAPAPVRSRVMGLMTMAIGTWPAGMMLAGWLGERIGPLRAFGVLGAAGLAWLAMVAAQYVRRTR